MTASTKAGGNTLEQQHNVEAACTYTACNEGCPTIDQS